MAEINDYQKDVRSLYDRGLDLSALRGTRILVAGATGLIGSCVVDVLMANPRRDYEVCAWGRSARRLEAKFGHYFDQTGFSAGLLDITEPIEADGPNFDFIIDAASNASPAAFKSHPVEVMKANVQGLCNLMEYGTTHGMKRMVYLSSGEIYGEGNGEPFNEKSSGYVDCATARACYPSSKRAAETFGVAYVEEYGQDVVIARLCHTYGPGFTESDNRVYAQFIRNVVGGEDIVLKSEGRQYRSWLYVVDAAHAILRLLLDGKRSNAYNVADAESNVTIRELAEKVATIAGRRVVLDIPSEIGRGNATPITRATFDTSKIQQLGWRPLFTLDEGLRHTLTVSVQGGPLWAT